MVRSLLITLFVALHFSLIAQPNGVTVEALKYEHTAWKRIVNTMSDANLLKNKDRFFDTMLGYTPTKRDIGFVCDRYKFSAGDRVWVTVAVFEGKVMQYVVDYTTDDHRIYEYIMARDTILSRKIHSLGNIKRNRSFFYQDDSLYAKFTRAVARKLGALNYYPPDSNRHLSACFQTLTSPVSELQFGDWCGIGADETKGYIAISYLVAQLNFSAIWAIVRGYNPEGRMFGVQALLEFVQQGRLSLTNDDMLAIKKVLDLDIEIKTCNGCSGRSVKPKEALRSDLLAIVNP